MNQDISPEKAFLTELYNATKGDPEAQVSMYDIGAALGMENDDTAQVAQDLMIQGFAEFKTLSGGIGITFQGIKELDIAIDPSLDPALQSLGSGTVLDESGTRAADAMLTDLKQTIAKADTSYPDLEEIVMDIKTIEVQMLSPNPKTAVIREVFRSLHGSISKTGPRELAARLDGLIK